MSHYHVNWPRWTAAEDGLSVYLLARGFESPDVARILSYKLHRPLRSKEAFFPRMTKLNLRQAHLGLPPLCLPNMVDWNTVAVDDFLLRLTNDTDQLENLLWFDREYLSLLHTVSLGKQASLARSFAKPWA